MTAVIAFESMFGNTQQIADAVSEAWHSICGSSRWS